MAHNSRCEKSTTDPRKCRCSCKGSHHGGTTRYSHGSASSASRAENGPGLSTRNVQPPRHTSPRDMTVTAQHALTEIIDWLAQNPTAAEQVTAIADLVAEQAVDALKKYGQAISRQELEANHFLCSLLAALAEAIDRFKQALDRVPDAVISMITGKSDQLSLNAVAVRIAVRSSWRLIMQLPIFSHIDNLLRIVRIAAVLACPDPDKHAEVLRNCLYPLGGDVISASTERRLEQLLTPKHVL
jgi:hypothetical protein